MLKFLGEHPLLVAFAILFGAGMVGAYWQAALFVIAAGLMAWGFGTWVTAVDRDHTRKLREMQRLEQDADFEMRLWTAGHPVGTFGRFTPYNTKNAPHS